MNKKYYIIGNWKMNPPSRLEALRLAEEIIIPPNQNKVEAVIMPPFVWLSEVKNILKEKPGLFLGAQDVFWQDQGAYTGEISPLMLKDLGIKYVMIGHSERKIYLKEDREMVKQKLIAVLRNGLIPILSFRPKTLDGLRGDLENIIEPIKEKYKILYLYEPTEAISTQSGQIPSLEEIKSFAKTVREIIVDDAKIIYGGSINASNATMLIKKTGIDGGLIGAKSLNAQEFSNIIRQFS